MTRPADARDPLPPVAETARLAGIDPAEVDLPAGPGEPTPRAFLDALMGAAKYGDAARYLAFALPKREAVWWACRCARMAPNAPRPGASTPEALAIQAAEAWVNDPTEENRRECGKAGEAAVGTPAGCASLAAFWSGGSLAPKGVPEVPPGPDLTARGVAAAVMVSGVIASPEKAPERYAAFRDIALAIAEGKDHWQPIAPAPAPPKSPTLPTAPPRPAGSSRLRDTWE